jgi:hypothetical protein
MATGRSSAASVAAARSPSRPLLMTSVFLRFAGAKKPSADSAAEAQGTRHALVAGVSPSQPLQVTPKITGKGAELTVFGSVVRQQGNLDGAGRGHRPHGKNVGHVVLPGRPLETRCHIVGVGHESLPPPGVPETVLLLKSSGN